MGVCLIMTQKLELVSPAWLCIPVKTFGCALGSVKPVRDHVLVAAIETPISSLAHLH